MIYLKLFWSFFQIGLFSVGGGYAAMPLIQHQVVELNNWLTMQEFVDIITISQMTPGPIAINSATFVGIQIAGLPGAIIATLGCVFPSCVIVLTLAWVYFRYRNLSVVQGVLGGLRPAVVAMIASAGLSILIFVSVGQRQHFAEPFLHRLDRCPFVCLCTVCLEKMETQPHLCHVGCWCTGTHFISAFRCKVCRIKHHNVM